MTGNAAAKEYFLSEFEWLSDTFRNNNVIVFGNKGAGKDVIFALAIHLLGGLHYANMPYNNKTLPLKSLKQLAVGGNVFKNLVNGDIARYYDPFIPGLPIYVSDGAVYFGSQNNSDIDKAYPGLSIFMALSRQLGEHQLHFNTQALGRLYIKIREQADAYIKALRTSDYGRFLVVDAISYERIESAEAGILPFNNGLARNSRGAQEHEGRYGAVEYHSFYVDKKWLHFDTHYFAKVFLKNKKELLQC